MNKPSTTPSEAVEPESVITSLNDPEAFASETTIELTEVVEGDDPEDPLDFELTIMDCHENRRTELENEVFLLGGLVGETRILADNCILAKVNFSRDLYETVCKSEGVEMNNAITSMRQGVHLVLKGNQSGFSMLGGNFTSHVDNFVREMAYDTIQDSGEFFQFSEMIQAAVPAEEERRARRRPRAS